MDRNFFFLLRVKCLDCKILFCLIIILITPLLEAKEKRGVDVLIRKTDETEVRGELIAVKSDSLLILEFKTGVDIKTYVNEIDNIKVIKKSHPWKGAGIGLLAIDKTYPFQGLPPGSVKVALNDLRKKARVKDFN